MNHSNIIPINHTTAFALRTLGRYTKGKVHSVYRRTVNLSFDGQLFALQSKGSPISPISFITALSASELEALDITSGALVISSKNKLTILGSDGNYSFRYGQAEILKTDFAPDLSASAMEKLKTGIKDVINAVHTNGLDLIFNKRLCEDSPLAIRAAGKRIYDARVLLSESRWKEGAVECSHLIGLGNGLTPSGDDFLCGILAGLKILKLDDHAFTTCLKSLIREHLKDTIDISAAFLACALEGEFSLAVNSLGNVPDAGEIKEKFLAIGHSSGIDTLCGISFILDALN